MNRAQLAGDLAAHLDRGERLGGADRRDGDGDRLRRDVRRDDGNRSAASAASSGAAAASATRSTGRAADALAPGRRPVSGSPLRAGGTGQDGGTETRHHEKPARAGRGKRMVAYWHEKGGVAHGRKRR